MEIVASIRFPPTTTNHVMDLHDSENAMCCPWSRPRIDGSQARGPFGRTWLEKQCVPGTRTISTNHAPQQINQKNPVCGSFSGDRIFVWRPDFFLETGFFLERELKSEPDRHFTVHTRNCTHAVVIEVRQPVSTQLSWHKGEYVIAGPGLAELPTSPQITGLLFATKNVGRNEKSQNVINICIGLRC